MSAIASNGGADIANKGKTGKMDLSFIQAKP
jgi:hypothetical protein